MSQVQVTTYGSMRETKTVSYSFFFRHVSPSYHKYFINIYDNTLFLLKVLLDCLAELVVYERLDSFYCREEVGPGGAQAPPLSLHPGVQGLEEPAVHVVLGQQQPARHRLTHQVVGIDHQVPHVQAGQRHATRAGHYENRKLV